MGIPYAGRDSILVIRGGGLGNYRVEDRQTHKGRMKSVKSPHPLKSKFRCELRTPRFGRSIDAGHVVVLRYSVPIHVHVQIHLHIHE